MWDLCCLQKRELRGPKDQVGRPALCLMQGDFQAVVPGPLGGTDASGKVLVAEGCQGNSRNLHGHGALEAVLPVSSPSLVHGSSW